MRRTLALLLLLVTGCSSVGDAGWTWNANPRVLAHGTRTWAGAISGAGQVSVYQYPGPVVTPIYDGAFDVDDHNNPVLLRRSSDGRLVAVWADHNDSVWMNVSTNPDDATSWQGETDITSQLGAGSYSYPQLFELSDGIHLFLRDGSASSADIVHSTLSGSTWSSAATFLPDGIYIQMAQTGDRLDLVSSKNPNSDPAGKLRHGYWVGGQWHASDGTEIEVDSASDLTLVQDVARPRGYDIVMGDTGPVVLFQHYTSYPSESEYRYAVWDGDSWEVESIVAAGGVLDGVEDFNVGGGCIDRQDPRTVYVSVKADGVWQMHRYKRGESWAGTALTASAEDDQIRPACPALPGRIAVLWLSGDYDGIPTFDMELAWLPRLPSVVRGVQSAWPSMRPGG